VILGGVLCIGVAAWIGAAHLRPDDSRLPVWMLLGAVGSVLLGGGFALTLVEEPTTMGSLGSPGDYVLVPRATWERFLQSPVARVQPPPPASSPPESPPPSYVSSAPEWVESGTVPVPPVQAPPRPPLVREDLVAAVSSEILAEARSSPPAPTPSASALAPSSPTPAAPASEGAAAGPLTGPVPMNSPGPGPAPPASAVPPTVAKGPETQLQSVLSLLERAEVTVRSRMVPPSGDPVRERCIGCGVPVTTYSEQVCVRCDRPLCDRCIDRTAAEGHPQMCESCSRSFPADLT
jgi:hypothetical protein